MTRPFLKISTLNHGHIYRNQTSKFYSFGSLLPGRKWEPTSTDKYRFGFNGKENTDEIYGEGNGIDFGARIYDGRLGRWMSLDPLQAKYQSLSPFSYGANNPIYYIDVNGKENVLYLAFLTNANDGKPVYSPEQQQEIIIKAQKILSDQGIEVKVIGVETDHRFNVGLLDKTDDVVYVGNTTQLDDLGIKCTAGNTLVGFALNEDNSNFSNQESYINTDRINLLPITTAPGQEKNVNELREDDNGEHYDNEGIAAICAIHESIGHNIFDKHREKGTDVYRKNLNGSYSMTTVSSFNILCDGKTMWDNIEPFPFEAKSSFLKFIPEDLITVKMHYKTLTFLYLKPNESCILKSNEPKYYHDSYTKLDKKVKNSF
jgi:RHS repeat-associated protein